MGRIHLSASNSVHLLPSSTIVGRSKDTHIQVDRPEVSRIHLILFWELGGWYVRSLSQSGTYINGRPLKVAEDCPLVQGDVLGLGSPKEDLRLVGSEAPEIFARNMETGEERKEGLEGILLPEGLVRLDLEQGWVLESGGTAAPLNVWPGTSEAGGSEGMEVGSWRFYLPEMGVRTRRASPPLSQMQLRLCTSTNLEHVSVLLSAGIWEVDLGIHAEFWPLLLLARARLGTPEGWMHFDALTKQSGLTRKCLDIYFGRIRRHLILAGVQGGEGIVESRRNERRVGLASKQLQVEIV